MAWVLHFYHVYANIQLKLGKNKKMKELITSVPPQDELELRPASLNPHAWESRLPRRFTDGVESEPPEKHMLDALSGELQFGGRDEASRARLVENGYRVARELGDSAVLRMSDKAFRVLEGLRRFSSNNTRFRASIHESDGEADGSVHSRVMEYADSDAVYAKSVYLDVHVDERQVFDGAMRENAKHRLAAENISILPAHLDLLTLVRIEAHEAAHVIHRSIDAHLSKDGYQRTMSEVALDSDSESALHSDRKVASAAHDERFAEGYAAMVLAETARALGYDEQMIGRIKRAYAFREANIAQYLDDSPSDIGYTMPLEAEQVIDDLERMADKLWPDNDWTGRLGKELDDAESSNDRPVKSVRRFMGQAANRLSSILKSARGGRA